MPDLKYAFRQLLKNPTFAAATILTLALGIGANTAIFSVIYSVLLKPLPYREPDRLVQIFENTKEQGSDHTPVSAPAFLDWQSQSGSFEAMAAEQVTVYNLTGHGQPRRLTGARVSATIATVLGVQPALGRVFTTDEDAAGKPRTVLLSFAFWQREFGGDKTILNRTLQLDGDLYTIIGVLPEGLNHPGTQIAFWVPMAFSAEEVAARQNHTLGVVGRLRPGIPFAQAQAELNTIAARSGQIHPESKGLGVAVYNLQEELVGNLRRPLYILLGAVAMVLLIACTNVANLMLARAATRHREFAIRAALGASRHHVYRQLLTEGVLLALGGGVLGSLLAVWMAPVLVALAPAQLPRLDEIHPNLAVFVFSLLISLGTGLVFGMAPTMMARRSDVNEILKNTGGATGSHAGHNRLRSGLVILELAVSMVLLTGAGLLLRSFAQVRSVDAGFRPAGLLTATLTLPDNKYPTESSKAAFFNQAVENARVLPGVDSAAAIFALPLCGFDPGTAISVEGRPALAPNGSSGAGYHQITPQYFKTMGTPMLRGRAFDARDSATSQHVVIVNESFVRRYFPAEEPLGRRITHGASGGRLVEIVGIVRDVRHRNLTSLPEPEVYVPMEQNCWGYGTLVVHTRTDPALLSESIRKAIGRLDSEQPLEDVKPMTAYIEHATAERQFQTILVGGFAGAALLLAGVGIYSVIAYWTGQRTREIGLRIALGAQLHEVMAMVLRQGMMLAAGGLGFGMVAALVLTRLLAGLLYGIAPTDLLTYASVATVLMAVALLACCLPAFRASRIDPMTALRDN